MLVPNQKVHVRQQLRLLENREGGAAVPTLASWLLTSVNSELSEAFWLRAVVNAASLLFSCVSKVLALDNAAARSPSLFLALDDGQKEDSKRVRIKWISSGHLDQLSRLFFSSFRLSPQQIH